MIMISFAPLKQPYDRRFLSAGDHGIVINMDDLPTDHATKAARALAHAIRKIIADDNIKGIEDMIPGLTNLLVQYNPLVTSAATLIEEITPLLATLTNDEGAGRLIHIPCCYGGEFGPDLLEVAITLNMSTDEVVKRHQSNILDVAIMGFLPGLAYMKGVDEALYLPRRKTPRAHVPALSLGIAMDQTVVYPLPSPGGWNLIGRVPIPLFDAQKSDPILLRAGDRVSFYHIDNNEYNKIASDYRSGHFKVEINP